MLNFRRSLMFARKKTVASIEAGKAGDICFYNLAEDRKIIVPFEEYDYSLYPSEEYYPLGVVVVPASHDVYGTGECGVVSLNWMRTDNAQSGGAYAEMYWSENTSSVFRYNGVPLLPNLTTNVFDSYNYYIGVGLMPYQGGELFPTGDNMDKDAGYQIVSGRSWYIPSPYLDDDSKNATYHMSVFSTGSTTRTNVLSDYKGKEHSLSFTASTYDYAIYTCSKYSPLGTSSGEWYLPTIGELGYIMPKWHTINNTLNILSQDYNIGYAIDNCMLWSVNGYTGDYRSKYILIINTNEMGLCTYTYGDTKLRSVRAFMRVKNENYEEIY